MVSAPIEGVILNRFVMVLASISLSGTLFSVMRTAESLPLSPTEVRPDCFRAWKAYSMLFMSTHLVETSLRGKYCNHVLVPSLTH